MSPTIASAFISYSHANKSFVHEVAKGLEADEYRVWLDDRDLKVGDSLIGAIAEALDRVDFVIAFVSPASQQSTWCKKEIALAMNGEVARGVVAVIPVRIDNAEMPASLLDKVYLDASGLAAQDVAARLSRDMQRHLFPPELPVRSLRSSPSAPVIRFYEEEGEGEEQDDSWKEDRELMLAYLRDRRRNESFRVDVLRQAGKLAASTGDTRWLEPTLLNLVRERSQVGVRAVRVVADLCGAGLVGPDALTLAARTNKWEVREAVINAAVKLDLPVSLDLIDLVAGSLSYWLPVQRAVNYISERAGRGDPDALRRLPGIVGKFLTNERLSEQTRSKLETLLAGLAPSL